LTDSRDQVLFARSRSYRTRSGPPQVHRLWIAPAGYSFLHKLHSRFVTSVRVGLDIRIFHHIGLVVGCLAGSVIAQGLARAGEYAVLTNGFRIYAERHEVDAGRIKLYSGGGVTEFAAEEVTAFEAEEAVPGAPSIPAAKPLAPVQAAPPMDIYSSAAEKHGLPVALVKSVVKAESNFQANAVSPKGAIGLMQLMPGTARELGVDANVPAQNVDAGTKYLRDLLIKYEGQEDQVARAVAAYNAGPGAVDKYKGVPPYIETQDYVRRVLREYLKTQSPD
jgi:soluble lytic murein transglycosylase-like protein